MISVLCGSKIYTMNIFMYTYLYMYIYIWDLLELLGSYGLTTNPITADCEWKVQVSRSCSLQKAGCHSWFLIDAGILKQ